MLPIAEAIRAQAVLQVRRVYQARRAETTPKEALRRFTAAHREPCPVHRDRLLPDRRWVKAPRRTEQGIRQTGTQGRQYRVSRQGIRWGSRHSIRHSRQDIRQGRRGRSTYRQGEAVRIP